MNDYLVDTSLYRSDSKGKMRIGHDGEIIEFRAKGGFAFSMIGDIGGDHYQMKLPAPWSRFRYRLEHNKEVIASASKHKFRGENVEFELDVQGRSLTLTSKDRLGVDWALSEGGMECGSFNRREFEDQEEWSADFTAPSNWSPATAAFVSWLICEAPEGRITSASVMPSETKD
mgnify:CR=1 FL=1